MACVYTIANMLVLWIEERDVLVLWLSRQISLGSSGTVCNRSDVDLSPSE